MDNLAVLVIWNVTALVALGVALVALGGALADWEYLRERHLNGIRSIQAGANLRNHAKRATVALLFLLIGLLALIEVPHRGMVSRWMLIVASVLLAAGGIFDWIDRRRIIQTIIRSEREASS